MTRDALAASSSALAFTDFSASIVCVLTSELQDSESRPILRASSTTLAARGPATASTAVWMLTRSEHGICAPSTRKYSGHNRPDGPLVTLGPDDKGPSLVMTSTISVPASSAILESTRTRPFFAARSAIVSSHAAFATAEGEYPSSTARSSISVATSP